ncbi:MAG: RNA pyrophosphohydrolase [Fibrobacterota bacterium]
MLWPKEAYRPNVCIVIRETEGDRLLSCHRAGFLMNQGWQFPQGGYNPGLNIFDEMRRELREEISTDSVAVEKISAREYYYEFPERNFNKKGGYRGQRQTWVLCRFTGRDADINVHTAEPEFDDWRWVTPEDAARNIVEFKRDIYYRALREFALL